MAVEATPLRRPRWGHKTSLFQVTQPAFYVFLVLVAFGLYLTAFEQTFLLAIAPAGWALSWVLLILYAVPVIILIRVLDLYEREPLSLVLGAFLWGAVPAIAFSGIGNTIWGAVIASNASSDFAVQWTPALTAPFVEELIKGSGVVLIYLIARREFDDVLDGFVYGAMVGLGFAVVENVYYFIAVFGGEPETVLQGFYLRVVASGLYSHVLYTGLTGIGVAYFATRKGEAPLGKRVRVAVGLFLVAVFAHFLWNSPLLDFFPSEPFSVGDWLLVPLATAVKGLPFLAFLVVMVRLARRREHRWLRAALASEVGKGGVTGAELDLLGSPAVRRRLRRTMRARAGSNAAAYLKQLQRQQINLAMIATRVEDENHPDLVRQREYLASLRDTLMKIPGAPEVLSEGMPGPS